MCLYANECGCSQRPVDLNTLERESQTKQCECWKLNSGPLEEQYFFITTELSIQPLHVPFFKLGFCFLDFFLECFILCVLQILSLCRIFIHFVGCLFTWIMVSFSLMRFHLSIIHLCSWSSVQKALFCASEFKHILCLL